MTQAQTDAYQSGIAPEDTDPRFLSQHLSAYAFTRQFVAGKRVLEIGFGDGYGSHYLAEVAKEVTGIDMAPGNIPRAKAKYPRANLKFLHMEGSQLAFPDGAFDVVGTFQVIEHIPEPEIPAFLVGIRRVLAPGGLAVISTLNLAHSMKPGQTYTKMCMHEKEFTAPELAGLLEQVFPSVALHGLYLTATHRLHQRLKKWGLNRLGPAQWNPVARFYDHMTVEAFTTRPGITAGALDLLAVCRTTPPSP